MFLFLPQRNSGSPFLFSAEPRDKKALRELSTSLRSLLMRAVAMKPRVRAIYAPIGGRNGPTAALIAAANPDPGRIHIHKTRRRGDFVSTPFPQIPPASRQSAGEIKPNCWVLSFSRIFMAPGHAADAIRCIRFISVCRRGVCAK